MADGPGVGPELGPNDYLVNPVSDVPHETFNGMEIDHFVDPNPDWIGPGFCHSCQAGHCESCWYQPGCYCAAHGHSTIHTFAIVETWGNQRCRPKHTNVPRQIHPRILAYRAEYLKVKWAHETQKYPFLITEQPSEMKSWERNAYWSARAASAIGPMAQCQACRNRHHMDCVHPGCLCSAAGHTSRDIKPGESGYETGGIRERFRDWVMRKTYLALRGGIEKKPFTPTSPQPATHSKTPPAPRAPTPKVPPEPGSASDEKEEWNQKHIGGSYLRYLEANSEQRYANQFVNDMALPGHLYDGKESCGKWKILGCLETELHKERVAHVKKVEMRCRNKGCKECYPSSISRESKSGSERLLTFTVMKKNGLITKKSPRTRILLHTILSPPNELHELGKTRDGRHRLREMGMRILERFDIDGGCQVDHAYRFSKGLEKARFSPHTHVIHTGWIDGKLAAQIWRETGWIINQVSTVQTWQECFSLFRYLLSHATVYVKEANRRSAEHSVRWFGECHNKKFKCATVLSKSASSGAELRRLFSDRGVLSIKRTKYPAQRITTSLFRVKDGESIKNAIHERTDVMKLDGFDERQAADKMGMALASYTGYEKRIIKDNPAVPQSVSHIQYPPLLFVLYRVDYGATPTVIEQSVSGSVVLDLSENCLCPECWAKIKFLRPKTDWPDSMFEANSLMIRQMDDMFTEAEPDDWMYEHDEFDVLGLNYFDDLGHPQNDPGLFRQPGCMDGFNTVIWTRLSQSIKLAAFVAQYRQNFGKVPTMVERNEFLHPTIVHHATADAAGQGRLV